MLQSERAISFSGGWRKGDSGSPEGAKRGSSFLTFGDNARAGARGANVRPVVARFITLSIRIRGSTSLIIAWQEAPGA